MSLNGKKTEGIMRNEPPTVDPYLVEHLTWGI